MTRRGRDINLQRVLAGLRALWSALERTDAKQDEIEARLATLERQAAAPDAQRVPLARAARMLGVSRQHAQRLAAAGVLDAADVREPEAARAVWTVSLESLERLLEERCGERLGPLGQPNPPKTGHQLGDP